MKKIHYAFLLFLGALAMGCTQKISPHFTHSGHIYNAPPIGEGYSDGIKGEVVTTDVVSDKLPDETVIMEEPNSLYNTVNEKGEPGNISVAKGHVEGMKSEYPAGPRLATPTPGLDILTVPNVSRAEKRAARKELRRRIMNMLSDKPAGGVDPVVLALLCIFIPPLAVYLVRDIGTEFWIDLLLTLLLFWLPGVIFAFIVVFG